MGESVKAFVFSKSLWMWHLLAVATIVFWGTSFVSTKVLIENGFSAVQIFTIRFAVTYLMLLGVSHGKRLADSVRDELLFVVGGVTGCTAYFWAENTALSISQSSNVSLIVCTNPLLIMLAGVFLFKKEKLSRRQVLGSLATFAGMVLVVLNGKFILKISPLGDFLAFGAAVAWMVYAFSTEGVRSKYSTFFAIRKVFFYGCMTSLPILAWDVLVSGHDIPWGAFTKPVVAGNFLCLCILSNLFGYLVWNKVMEKLGTVLASNYIYAVPLVTMLTAAICIGELISVVALVGAFFIVMGMVLAEYRKERKK